MKILIQKQTKNVLSIYNNAYVEYMDSRNIVVIMRNFYKTREEYLKVSKGIISGKWQIITTISCPRSDNYTFSAEIRCAGAVSSPSKIYFLIELHFFRYFVIGTA